MSIETINDFRERYLRFLKWDPYMCKRRLKSDPESQSWKNLVEEFLTKVCDPLDEAWNKLTDIEKKIFLEDDSTEKQVFENVPF